MIFSPVQTYFFAPNQKETFFSSPANKQANFVLPIQPHFSASFVNKHFIFYSFLNKLLFHNFLLFSFPKKTIPPLPHVSSGRPLTSRPIPCRCDIFVLHACAFATFSYPDTYVNFVKYTGGFTTKISTQISAAFFGCR